MKESRFVADAPKVKFRGIFLNDEDWGLKPWASKTFEPETGDIGLCMSVGFIFNNDNPKRHYGATQYQGSEVV